MTRNRTLKPLRLLLAALAVAVAAWGAPRVCRADQSADNDRGRAAPSTTAEGPRNFPWVSSSLSGASALPPAPASAAEKSRTNIDPPPAAAGTGSPIASSSTSARASRANDGGGRLGEALPDLAADKSVRLREGTELKDRLAVFKPAGDRTLCFVSGVPHRMIVLENLALERVLQTLDRSSVELQWSIRGVVSEYRGANYLLIQRAVVLGPTGVPRSE